MLHPWHTIIDSTDIVNDLLSACAFADKPNFVYWEALDMIRKFMLVGVVLLVRRGSIAQLCLAIFLSFGFFSLQMKTWPYKHEEDNMVRPTLLLWYRAENMQRGCHDYEGTPPS